MKRGAENHATEKATSRGRLDLLGDERARAWYDDMAQSDDNRLAAVTNVRKLSFLLEQIELSLDEVERLARKDSSALSHRLQEYATRARGEGRLATYLRKLFSALRSYLAYRAKKTGRKIEFDGYPKLKAIQGASIRREKVPSQVQLGEILERLSNRGRVIALLMAHAGVRPQVIGAYEGARGLVLSDLPDLDLKTLKFGRVPFEIRGRGELSKTTRCWTTFGSQSLATAIEAYLGTRRDGGEKLGANSPLVTVKEIRGIAARSREEARSKLGFLTTTHVVLEIGNVLHATAPEGIRWRPYVLRGYFSTGMIRAGVDRDLREAMMAHDTGVSGAYTVGKPWGDDLLEKARAEYERACEFIEPITRPKADVNAELLQSLARKIEESTGKRGSEPVTLDQLHSILREALGGSATATVPGPVSTAPSLDTPRAPLPGERTKTVSIADVDSWTRFGWDPIPGAINMTHAVLKA